MGRHFQHIRLTIVLILIATVFAGPDTLSARDALYNRNGEAYLLLGGDYCLYRGVYRLNNPSKDLPVSNIGYLYDPGPSMALAVDLDRNLYTTSVETTDLSSMQMLRQVVDDTCLTDWTNSAAYASAAVKDTWTAAERAGFGAHQSCHHYLPGASNSNRGVLYRAGSSGTQIWGSASLRPDCGGPGSPMGIYGNAPLPPGYITVMVPGEDSVYAGKQWYAIPNGSWYSSWNTSTTDGNYSGLRPQPPTSYVVNQDTFTGNNYNWKLLSWRDGQGDPTTGPTVGSSYEYSFSRNRRNACLDSCNVSNNPYGVTFVPRFTSVAFMPYTMNGNVQTASRTYFFSKEKTTSSYYISIRTAGGDLQNYTPSGTNPILGTPGGTNATTPDKGTRWIGVSSKNAFEDWVYTLGTADIQSWYNAAANANVTNMFIDGVSVSNQWNQKGGIIFAFDKTSNSIYKLVRDETLGVTTEYEIFSGLSNILDIKADGDGNVYYCREVVTPVNASGLNDSHIVNITAGYDPAEPITNGQVIFGQTTARNVYQRIRGSATENFIGSQTTGLRYYIRNFRYPTAGGEMSLAYAGFADRLVAQGGNWVGQAVNPAPFPWVDASSPPNRTELAVINVPAPPVVSGSGSIDLIGPYASFPAPSNNSTNQGGFTSAPSGQVPTLLKNQVYFYQVENYPLYPVSQVPETDWNGNGFLGGFLTSIINPDPSATPPHITYNWILWNVEDPSGKPISLADAPHVDPSTPDTTPGETFGIYSPAGGKYILTCKVVYDFYDYDRMPYGSMFADREDYKVIGSISRSVGATTVRNNVKNTLNFGFLSASDLTAIIPDSNWAAIPILVATDTNPPTYTETLTAAIERWDCTWDNPGAVNPMTACTWSQNAVHGIDAGALYGWRIALASQTNIMMDISGSTNITPGTADYNWIAHQLQNSSSDLFMNNPNSHNITTGIEFRNQLGDLAWEGDANFTGTLIATTPSGLVSLPLFGGGSGGTSNVATFSKLTVDWPTDPKEAILKITANRMFKVKAWVWDNQYSRYLSKFWMKKMVTLTGQTKVLVIDRQKPVLEQDYTSPRNIFATTGGTIVSNEGPAGKTNPASLSIVISDDNPWENGNVEGISKTTAEARIAANNVIRSNANRDSTMNLASVFSKELRNVSIEFELASPATHVVSLSYNTIPTANIASAALNNPGTALTDMRALIGYSVNPISNLYSGIIPINYANNTPGYAPYKFRITMTDSSGNTQSAIPLNTALHVRDNRAPIMWAVITSRKDGVPRTFPKYDTSHLATSGFEMPDSGNNITWSPDLNGNLPVYNGGPVGTSLKSIGTTVTKTFTDAQLINQIKASVPPGYFEDNVEFDIMAYVSDNAGAATNTLQIIVPTFGSDITTTVTSNRSWGPDPGVPTKGSGVFLGAPDDFPMALPVTMTAKDNARTWNYYPDDWKTTSWPSLTPAVPAAAENTRVLNTSVSVYGSDMTLRILEKDMR